MKKLFLLVFLIIISVYSQTLDINCPPIWLASNYIDSITLVVVSDIKYGPTFRDTCNVLSRKCDEYHISNKDRTFRRLMKSNLNSIYIIKTTSDYDATYQLNLQDNSTTSVKLHLK